MYIIACDVNTFAKSLWSAVNNSVCKGIYVTTRFRPLINCRINKGRTSIWKEFSNGLFLLVQILRFAYFPVKASSHKIVMQSQTGAEKSYLNTSDQISDQLTDQLTNEKSCSTFLVVVLANLQTRFSFGYFFVCLYCCHRFSSYLLI